MPLLKLLLHIIRVRATLTFFTAPIDLLRKVDLGTVKLGLEVVNISSKENK